MFSSFPLLSLSYADRAAKFGALSRQEKYSEQENIFSRSATAPSISSQFLRLICDDFSSLHLMLKIYSILMLNNKFFYVAETLGFSRCRAGTSYLVLSDRNERLLLPLSN